MEEITYTLAELCERIEEVHGKIVEAFTLRYPTDPRCKYQEYIWVKGTNWDMTWWPANEADNVCELVGYDVIGFEWHPEPGKILKIVVRKDEER